MDIFLISCIIMSTFLKYCMGHKMSEDSLQEISYHEFMDRVSVWFKDGTVIPFFGSGFTKGCNAKNGKVPDARECANLMRKIIKESGTEDGIPDDFYQVAECFLDDDYVSEKRRRLFLSDFFTEVCIEGDKKDLINLNWPYAYTLNVDDGIERNSNFIVVVSQNKIRERDPILGKNLYKLHGDALSEINYDESSIIFHRDQYIVYLQNENNKRLFNNIVSDFKTKNIVFIGCSLNDEADLKYLYSTIKEDEKSVSRIWITDKNPAEKLHRKTLMKHGVNAYVKVDSWEEFYKDLVRSLSNSRQKGDFKFRSPGIKELFSSSDKKQMYKLLSGESIFDKENNKFIISGLHIERDCVDEISNLLEQKDCVLLKGRHFSGKTYILASLIQKINNKTVYFFPSDTHINADIVNELFESSSNSLFVFDSNSVSDEIYNVIRKNVEKNRENRNKLVIALNSNDLLDRLDASLVTVDTKYSDAELATFNRCADRYALIRRHNKRTNIDYLCDISEKQKIAEIKKIFDKLTIVFSKKEYQLLIMLAMFRKVYVSEALALGFSIKEFEGVAEKSNGLIECIKTDVSEANKHSTIKLVQNSTAFLIERIKSFDINDVIDTVVEMVCRLKNDYERREIKRELIKFDNLNYVFPKSNYLIQNIYSDLEDILYDDGHFWLQRAKSIYHFSQKDARALKDAYSFAEKAHYDARKNSSLYFKSALTKALICAQLFILTKQGSYQTEAIDLAYDVLFNDKNTCFIKREIQSSHGRLISLLSNVCNSCESYSASRYKADEILTILKQLKRKNG